LPVAVLVLEQRCPGGREWLRILSSECPVMNHRLSSDGPAKVQQRSVYTIASLLDAKRARSNPAAGQCKWLLHAVEAIKAKVRGQ